MRQLDPGIDYHYLLPERSILAIADDLTGALEAGAKFAARGHHARVTSDRDAAVPSSDVFVVNSETRHLTPADAAEVVHGIGQRLSAHRPWLVYKKTDSTLRGNIAAELGGLARAFPERRILYVPAYPAMGRTVRNGLLHVDGIPAHETAFATDPLNPIRDSAVQAALGSLTATIMDGESEADILAVARSIAVSEPPLLVAGPAAIAGALAEVMPAAGQPSRAMPELRRLLVVNGSMHPASALQIGYARRYGLFGRHWILFDYDGNEAGVERARYLGGSVKRYLQENAVDAVVVFGGDTAYGIHQALGASEFTCWGEVLPGVPLAEAGGLVWITKAGGFGKPNMIEELQRTLPV